MPTLIELFKTGYDIGESMPREARARQAARQQFGAAADNPALFNQLQQLQNMQQNRQIAQSQETRAQGTYDFNMQAAQQDQKKQAVLGLVNGLRQARDRGEDVGAAFDRMSKMLPQMGVDPVDIPQMRQSLVDNPAILDDYYRALVGPPSAAEQAAQAKLDAAKAKTAQETASQQEAKQNVSRTIGTMRDLYTQLDEAGGIRNPDASIGGSVVRALKSSWAGRTIGGITGTENESFRRTIEGLRPKLLIAIKAAEGLGAKMFDSNKDMEMWLSTVTDPSQDIDTVMTLLDDFERQYGAATSGNPAAVQPITVDPTTATQPSTTAAQPPRIYPGYTDPNSGMVFKGGDPGDQANWGQP